MIFIIILAINLILAWVFQEILMTRDMYHSIFSDQLENYRIDEQLRIANRYKLWGYIILPLIIYLKFVIVSLLLQLPLLLKFIEISFNKIYRVVMFASLAFVVMNIVYMLWIFQQPVTAINENMLKVIPLSLGNLVDISRYSSSTISLLSTLNIFEGCWLAILFYGFTIIAGDKISKTDVFMLVISVWCFLFILKFSLLIFMEKIFG